MLETISQFLGVVAMNELDWIIREFHFHNHDNATDINVHKIKDPTCPYCQSQERKAANWSARDKRETLEKEVDELYG